MRCANCGGTARYVEEHHYFECNFCGAHQKSPRSKDGVELLGEPPDRGPVSCPRCSAALVRARVGRWGLLACERCEGLLFEQPDFAHVVRFERARYGGPQMESPLDRGDLERPPQACPLCAATMERSRYFGPGNIFMDVCAACARIWLDGGELTRIIRGSGTF